MKRLVLVFLLIAVCSCSKNNTKEFSLTNHIPDDSELVIISKEMGSFLNDLSENELLKNSGLPFNMKTTGQLKPLENFNLSNETALAFSNSSTDRSIYTLITKKDSSLLTLDSIKNKSVETIKEDDLEFQKISIDDAQFFLFETETASIISNSKSKISEIEQKENLLKSSSFNKAYQASNPNKTTLFFNHTLLGSKMKEFFMNMNFPGFENFADWSMLDIDISISQLTGNGISLGENKGLSIFTNSIPQRSETGQICPGDFVSFSSANYENFEIIYSNQNQTSKDSLAPKLPAI